MTVVSLEMSDEPQFSPPIYKREDPYFSSSAYKAIKRNNPKGYEIRKRK